MPQPAGLQQINTTNTATPGTTSLTLGRPTDTLDNDILLMFLAHKGAGYATVPAGWALVAQDLHVVSGMRGEVYWKRASGEPANYSVTGLADTAEGGIRGWRGGRLAGSPIDVSAFTNFDAGGSGSQVALTPTVPNCVVVAMTAAADNNITNAGGIVGNDTPPSTSVILGNTANGTDCGIAVEEAFMVVPSAVTGNGGNTVAAGVTIICALIPETGGATAGTRYFPTMKPPGVRFDELVAGDWDLIQDDPSTLDVRVPWTFECSQQTDGGGTVGTGWRVTTNQNQVDVIIGRFKTPALEAQTVSGTFNLNYIVNSRLEVTGLGNVGGGQVRYKVHIYITVGQTAQVRHVLVNNVVDGADWTTAATAAWTALSAPIALSSGNALAGDSVMIEIGASVISIPVPVPTYPPGEYLTASFRSFGTAAISGVPWIAGTTGTTVTRSAYFDFSHTFVEQAPPASPPNIDPTTAVEIAIWPHTGDFLDTRRANGAARGVWYKFTAPSTGRCFISVLGTNYNASLGIYDEGAYTNQSPDLLLTNTSFAMTRSITMSIVDAIGGQTYYIVLFNLDPAGVNGQSSGGAARLVMSWYSAPQEDDLYIPASFTYALRDGVIVNANPVTSQLTTTGIAIEYSQDPLPDQNNAAYPTPTHTGYRLLVGDHDFSLVEVFDLDTMNVNELEMCFIGAAWNDTPPADHNATLHMARDGTLYAGWFGNGYLLVNGASSTPDAAFYNYVSDDAAITGIRAVDFVAAAVAEAAGGFIFATTYVAAAGPLAPWHIELQPDGVTMAYVAGGFYYDESQIAGVVTDHRATTIKQYNIGGASQGADFATIPLSAGPREGLYGLAIHPLGDVLVCNGPTVTRLNSSGSIQQTYTFPEEKSRALVDVVYNHDGTKFWVFDQASATLFFVDVETGAILQAVDTYFSSLVTTQMAIYQPTGITPIPPTPPGAAACPAPALLPVIGQNACAAPNVSAN